MSFQSCFGIILLFHVLCVMSTMNDSSVVQQEQCHQFENIDEIKSILEQQPCPFVDAAVSSAKGENQRRIKRWPSDNTDNKINAIHGTINEHRTMINYLINNSINATFVSNAIADHHVYNGPIWSSWRDLQLLFCFLAVVIGLIYLLICRSGLTPCNRCLIFLSNQCQPHNQVQQKEIEQNLEIHITKYLDKLQQQQQQNYHKDKREQIQLQSMRRQKQANLRTSPSIISDLAQYNTGYISE